MGTLRRQQRAKHLERIRLVIDHADLHSFQQACPLSFRRDHAAEYTVEGRQTNDEGGSEIKPVGPCLDASAMEFAQALHQCEADSEAAVTTSRGAAAGLREHVEDRCQVGGFYPSAVVPDLDFRAVGDGCHANMDRPAGRGELDGVAREIPDDLLETEHVGEDRHLRQFQRQRNALLLRLRANGVGDALDNRRNANRSPAQRQLAGGDSRKIQQIVDDQRLTVNGAPDDRSSTVHTVLG